jgi:hypothetical protein
LISACAALPARADSTAAKPQTTIFFIVLLPPEFIFLAVVILSLKQSALQATFAGTPRAGPGPRWPCNAAPSHRPARAEAATGCALRVSSHRNRAMRAVFCNVLAYLDCHYCALAMRPGRSSGKIRRGAGDTLGLQSRVNVNIHRAETIRPRGGMQSAGASRGGARRTISSLK